MHFLSVFTFLSTRMTKMKSSSILLLGLLGLATAAPAELRKRQATQNDLQSGSCKNVILIFARASTEPGNMGMSMGPVVCSGLKKNFPDQVACQGVGGAYSAGLAENVAPAGTTAGAIAEATKMFTTANTKCPQAVIVAGGYSQGTAVMMNSISKLPANIKSKLVGVVLFGYTKNGQQKGGIPDFPKEKIHVYCSSSDGVCGGALLVTAGHFSYMGDGSGPQSIAFLTEKIKAATGKGSGGAASSGQSPSTPQPAPKGGAPKGGSPKGGAPKGGVPKGGAPPGGAPPAAPPVAPPVAPPEAPAEAPPAAPAEAPVEAPPAADAPPVAPGGTGEAAE